MTDPSIHIGDHRARSGDVRLGKVYYFTFLAAASCLLPILSLYYEQRGLSGEQIGFLASIPPLMTLFGASIWGGLADATGLQKRLVTIAMLGVTLSAGGILLSVSFTWLFVSVLIYSFFFAPLFPLSDNSILGLLRSEPHRYGRIRLWGSIGWGITAPLIGAVVESRGLAWGFYGFISIMLIGAAISLRLPASATAMRINYRKGLTSLFRDRRWPIFLGVIFIGGIGLAVVDNYLFLYLKSMQASNTLMGLALTFAVLSEIVIFYFMDRILTRWGVRRILITALVLYVIRLLLLSLVHTPWMVLLLQLMHGPTYALMWAAGVAHAKGFAPAGMAATAQGLLSSAYSGLGAVAGAILGGFLYEHVGPHLMYRWASLIVFLGLALYIASQYTTENGGL